MRKIATHIMFIVIFLVSFTMIISCNSKNNSKDSFNIEQMQKRMKVKNYDVQIQDAEKDFLPTERKRLIIGNEALDIYLFTNNENMEKQSGFIHHDGLSYDNGNNALFVEWIAPPHFYKKGNIIVQYVGTNKKIISDLKDILGEQFAGEKYWCKGN